VADLAADDATQMEVLAGSIALWNDDVLGKIDRSIWERTAQTLISMGLLKAPVDVTTAYSEAFLPK
jgi:hypothetical protein